MAKLFLSSHFHLQIHRGNPWSSVGLLLLGVLHPRRGPPHVPHQRAQVPAEEEEEVSTTKEEGDERPEYEHAKRGREHRESSSAGGGALRGGEEEQLRGGGGRGGSPACTRPHQQPAGLARAYREAQ